MGCAGDAVLAGDILEDLDPCAHAQPRGINVGGEGRGIIFSCGLRHLFSC